MAICAKCKKLLPPGFMENTEYGEQICLFCRRDTKVIYYGEGNQKTATKKEIVRDYKKMLEQLAKNNKIKEAFKKGMIKDIKSDIA